MAGNCIIYLIAGFIGGLWMIYGGVKEYLLLQKINNTPTSKVASAAVGFAELYGKARCPPDLRTPISGVPCGFWRLVAEYYKSGKGGGWKKFYNTDSSVPFELEDESGKMLVDPKGAEIEIPADCAFEGYISGKGVFGVSHAMIDERVLKFINASKEDVKKKFMSHQHLNVRVTEYFIGAGDEVYALGTLMPRENMPSSVGYENLVMKKGNDIMYLSDSSEKKIAGSLSTSVKWSIGGGLALSAICIFLIILFLVPSQ